MASSDDPAIMFEHGLPNDHDDKVVKQYARYRLKVYRDHFNWKGDLLLEFYVEDFEPFTQEMFRNLPFDLRKELRTYLDDNGVYVPKGPRTSIPNSLYRRLKEDLQPDERVSATDNNGAIIQPQVQSSTPAVSVQASREESTERTRGSQVHYALSSLMKTYTHSKDKYNGSLTDNFESKLTIFQERCELSGLPEEHRAKPLSLMLDGAALQYYFDNIKGRVNTFDDMISKLRHRFLTQERPLHLQENGTRQTCYHIYKLIQKNPETML